ncbi:hypothetical protein Esti_006490 [Eimeria stiedai]
MAATARSLAAGNGIIGSKVHVLQQPVETVQLSQLGGEKVDILVSEPLGTLLFNERMIESYLFARDHFLKPGGLMFPRRSRLFCAPFTDAALFAEVSSRGGFWQNENFYGVDLRQAVPAATEEAFRQPVVDYVDPRCLVAEAQCKEFDFASVQVEQLHEIHLSFTFEVTAPCVIHGVATWFTVEFEGSDFCVGFSTGPEGAPTHWFQLRLLMRPAIAANGGQKVKAELVMKATQQQSYKIDGQMQLLDTPFSSSCKDVDLKDPDYRYCTNPTQSYCPLQVPGDAFWSYPSPAKVESNETQKTNSLPNPSSSSICAKQETMPYYLEGGEVQEMQLEQNSTVEENAEYLQRLHYEEDAAAVNDDMLRVFKQT